MVIAAAGNSNTDTCTFTPANTEAMAVGATDSSDSIASFLNHGECTDIFAPGRSILSVDISSSNIN